MSVDCLFLIFRLLLAALQDRKNYVSLPPLMENGAHDEAAIVAEQDGGEESPPPTYSPSEEVEEEEEEDTAPPAKRRKRKQVDSTAATSPLKEAAEEEKDSSGSSSEPKEPVDPLVVTPLDSAPPAGFGRMPSPSMSSDGEDVDR